MKPLRRLLRRDQTKYELMLWSKLRKQQMNGFRFLRQYSIGKYILDFYCPEKKLGIELDGGQHNEQENIKHDVERTTHLKGQEIRILRFWNNEVSANLEGVLETIVDALES